MPDVGVLIDAKTDSNIIQGMSHSFTKRAMLFNGYRTEDVPYELLHTLGLEHSFEDSEDYTFRKLFTNNIMDYSSKRNHLWHRQWKKIWTWLDN